MVCRTGTLSILRLGRSDKDEKGIFSFTSAVVTVTAVVVVDNELVVVEDSGDSGTGGGLETGSISEGKSGDGLWLDAARRCSDGWCGM